MQVKRNIMNNDLTNKEQEIKDVVDGMSFDLNTDELWAHVESHLPAEEDKKRPVVWWMTGIAGVLLLAITAFYLSSVTENQTESITTTADFTSNSEKLVIPKSIVSEIETSQEKVAETITDALKNEKSANTIKTIEKNISETQTRDAHNERSNTNIQSSINDFEILRPRNAQNTVPFIQFSNQEASQSQKSRTDTKFVKKEEVKEVVRNNRSTSAIARLDASLEMQIRGIELFSTIIGPVKNVRWNSHIGLYSGIVIGNPSISSLNPEGIDMAQFDKESVLPGLSTSLMYGMKNNKGWLVNIGLQHNRLVGRYTNFDKVSSTSLEAGNTSYRIDSDGIVSANTGDVNVTTITQNNVVWHRTHDYLNLRGELGKNMFTIGRFSTTAFVSAGYNIWSRHDGYYFEEGKDIITTFLAGSENPYQNQGVSLGGGLSMSYDLGNVSIGISTQLEQALQNSTKSNNYYQLKNSQYGIQLGVVYTP